ncbi:MAG: hypothetical protein KDD12_21975, partial [Lewinella sp.]|nr:hypothetical protein [Lewinella sp.]
RLKVSLKTVSKAPNDSRDRQSSPTGQPPAEIKKLHDCDRPVTFWAYICDRVVTFNHYAERNIP